MPNNFTGPVAMWGIKKKKKNSLPVIFVAGEGGQDAAAPEEGVGCSKAGADRPVLRSNFELTRRFRSGVDFIDRFF
jgi:hypothetical protein